jgi:hypothetical protein
MMIPVKLKNNGSSPQYIGDFYHETTRNGYVTKAPILHKYSRFSSDAYDKPIMIFIITFAQISVNKNAKNGQISICFSAGSAAVC